MENITKKVGLRYSFILRRFAIGRFKYNKMDVSFFRQKDDNFVFECYEKKFGSDILSDHKQYLKEKKKEETVYKQGYVYFIVNNEYTFCKIGFSDNPEKRISEIQTGCPYSLRLSHFINGTISDEKALHEKYKHLNSSGEWFFIKDELKEYLDSIICKNVLVSKSTLKQIKNITENDLLTHRGALVETQTKNRGIVYFDSMQEKGKYEVIPEKGRSFFAFPHNMTVINFI